MRRSSVLEYGKARYEKNHHSGCQRQLDRGHFLRRQTSQGQSKAAKKAQKTGNVIARYDKNNNGFIDADEVEAIQKAFGTDAALKQFDKNGDGKLDEIEVSAMNPQSKKKKK